MHSNIPRSAQVGTALNPTARGSYDMDLLPYTDQPAAAEHGAGSAAGGLGNAGRVALPCMRCVADVGLVPNTASI